LHAPVKKNPSLFLRRAHADESKGPDMVRTRAAWDREPLSVGTASRAGVVGSSPEPCRPMASGHGHLPWALKQSLKRFGAQSEELSWYSTSRALWAGPISNKIVRKAFRGGARKYRNFTLTGPVPADSALLAHLPQRLGPGCHRGERANPRQASRLSLIPRTVGVGQKVGHFCRPFSLLLQRVRTRPGRPGMLRLAQMNRGDGTRAQ